MVEDWTKKKKTRFLTALSTVIKNPTASIRKYANELKVHKKTAKKKQDLSPDLNPLDDTFRKQNKYNFSSTYWLT